MAFNCGLIDADILEGWQNEAWQNPVLCLPSASPLGSASECSFHFFTILQLQLPLQLRYSVQSRANVGTRHKARLLLATRHGMINEQARGGSAVRGI